MNYKTENQVFADIIGVIRSFFESMGENDWVIRQGYQPRQETLQNKAVTLWRVYSSDNGFQGEKYLTDDNGNYIMRQEVQKEISMQVDFFRKREPIEDNINTKNAIDYANLLKVYLSNSVGIAELQELGYGFLRIENFREPKRLTPSGLYESFPGFDLVILYWQEVDTPVESATFENIIIEGV